MKNLPTLLTAFRIIAAPVLAALVLYASTLLYGDPYLAGFIYALTFLLFVIAALTDWLDGWLARKLDAVTPLGAALDHAADKVLITCTLVALAFAALPLPLVAASVLILGRDVAVAGLREGIAAQGKSLPVSQLGKWKAAAEMAGVGAFLAFQTAALLRADASIVLGLNWAASILIWIAAALALVSGAQYLGALLKRN
ncbi:MAG: CDP-diacylglycerol--glycerol-3-phosphate 3-phosphatidyltransferase [Caulobacterales bacterium]|jgi:CDP-diacylglycerol--glycerol-3-phosphate 3-phosphatidyltransferase|nr:CDP-diacylglycerol--glycerol-3-phosphate 3-phosphatidyltransferase [Caulobacterales bacterium]